jgi:hypothetical protein
MFGIGNREPWSDDHQDALDAIAGRSRQAGPDPLPFIIKPRRSWASPTCTRTSPSSERGHGEEAALIEAVPTPSRPDGRGDAGRGGRADQRYRDVGVQVPLLKRRRRTSSTRSWSRSRPAGPVIAVGRTCVASVAARARPSLPQRRPNGDASHDRAARSRADGPHERPERQSDTAHRFGGGGQGHRSLCAAARTGRPRRHLRRRHPSREASGARPSAGTSASSRPNCASAPEIDRSVATTTRVEPSAASSSRDVMSAEAGFLPFVSLPSA